MYNTVKIYISMYYALNAFSPFQFICRKRLDLNRDKYSFVSGTVVKRFDTVQNLETFFLFVMFNVYCE